MRDTGLEFPDVLTETHAVKSGINDIPLKNPPLNSRYHHSDPLLPAKPSEPLFNLIVRLLPTLLPMVGIPILLLVVAGWLMWGGISLLTTGLEHMTHSTTLRQWLELSR